MRLIVRHELSGRQSGIGAVMPDLKDLALQASNNAFVAAVQNTITNLMTAFIQTTTADDREKALELHRAGLLLCKTVHEVSVAAINDVFVLFA
jgi:aspartyl/asparaginyl beta-hydroxylase (cupin superfamily)